MFIGYHRYVLLVYKQQNYLNFERNNTSYKYEDIFPINNYNII